jgi:hypothetical protein
MFRTVMRLLLAVALLSGALGLKPAEATNHNRDVYGCDPENPVVQDLQHRVQEALDVVYPNLAVLASQGYFPYYDAAIPLVTGYSHWLNPWYFDKGIGVDPLRPQSVLVDEWGRPFGMMFIGDIDVEGEALYLNDDGTECRPWHDHADAAARSYFWYYRILWQGNTTPPERTPEMMHVWYGNSRGVFAHDPPPAEEKKGPGVPPLPWKCTDYMREQGWCPSERVPE